MWQQTIVGTIVLVAVLYALWYWLPAGLRKRLGRVQKNLGQAPGCGACSSCGGCPAPGLRQPSEIKPIRENTSV